MSSETTPSMNPLDAPIFGPDDEIIYDGSHRMRFSFEDLTKSLSIKRRHLKEFIAMIENDPDLIKELIEITKIAEREVEQGLIEASPPVRERYNAIYMKLQEFAFKITEVEPGNFLFYMKNIAIGYILRKYTNEASAR